ncbi:MAG: hypothetical protein Q9160_003112 [Pyrenula sp. 1 TL-2023]
MALVNSVPAKEKRWPPQTGAQNPTSIVKKPIRASGSQNSLRSQNKSPVSLSPQLRLAKSSSSPRAPISQLPSTKRKRSEGSEAEADEPENARPAKQRRSSTPPSLEPSQEKLPNGSEAGAEVDGPESPSGQSQEPPLLSERDSQSLESIYKNMMERESNKPLKRSSSRSSIAQSGTGSDQTQRSSISNATYRRLTLAAVNIHFHVKPPDAVETTIETIVNAELTKQRQDELDVVAKEFHDGCLKNVRAQTGEDDFLDPLHTAIKTLGLKNICIREKAAWRLELKPIIQQQQRWSSSFMADIQQREVDDASAPLPKRQQRCNNEYMSPESSMTSANTPSTKISQESIVKPPAVPAPEKDHRSPVKTPRPDLSIGIELDTLISALYPTLDSNDARSFIDWLQEEMVQHESGGPSEPMLIPIPALRAGDLAFPFAVIEGKAYSTGKQIFEAENQAAVSMACAHNILHRLDRMANDGTTASTQTRVLFSITTEGPIHELWAHWTVVKSGVRMFESVLWDSWNGLVQSRALDFIVKLHNVCVWGTGPFMESAVEGLKKVATQADTRSSR